MEFTKVQRKTRAQRGNWPLPAGMPSSNAMDPLIPSREQGGRLVPPKPLPKDITYVLDTQALRGLSGELIKKGRALGYDLAISPFTLTEVFCHLGEKGKGGFTFDKRGQILKANYARLLPEPHSSVVAFYDRTLDMGSELSDFLKQTLELLENSTLPEELSAIQGRVREALLVGAEKKREFHNQLEEDHTRIVHAVAARLVQLVGIKNLDNIPDPVVMAAALGPVLRPSWDFAGRSEESSDAEGVHWLVETYFPISYLIARTRDYVIKAGSAAPPLPIDPHDMEDQSICAHLSLERKAVIVTGDQGTIRALTEAHQRLERLLMDLPAVQKSDAIWRGARVLQTDRLAAHLRAC